MAEQPNPFDLLLEQIREVVRQEIAAALNGNGNGSGEDHLLTPEEAAEKLHVKPCWLYRHAKKLPFTRKLSRKMLRFSETGLLRWQAAKKNFQAP